MSRRNWSFGAVAAFAAANLVFSSAHSAEAETRSGIEPGFVALTLPDEADDTIERVPDQPLFVSQEVVQPLPAPTPSPVSGASGMTAASLGELVQRIDTRSPLSEEMQCLAGAVYFEARGEALSGQLAVAQVIINRTEDPRFPASYCGVVQQAGQFSFVKNGRTPHIRTHSAAWARARAIAQIAHEGLWQSEAEGAVFFHARYVRPQWSQRKQRLAQIDTHIFYR